MKKKIKLLLAVTCLLSLAACKTFSHQASFFRKDDKAYLKSQNGPDLVLASGMDRNLLSDQFLIPDVRGQVDIPMAPPGNSIQ